MDEALAKKALEIIESLAVTAGMIAPDDERWAAIFKYAHIAQGSCENTHEDWKNELESAHELLRAAGLI